MNAAGSVLVPAHKSVHRPLWGASLVRKATSLAHLAAEASPVVAGAALILLFNASNVALIAGLLIGAGGLARLSLLRSGEPSGSSGDQS